MEPKFGETKQEGIVKKKEDIIGIPQLSTALSSIPLSSLTPVLVKSFGDRSKGISPHDVFSDYNVKNHFYGPSSLDQRHIHKFSGFFYDVLPENFRAVEISPIAPFGLNSSVTKLSQDLVLTSIRGNEVQGDSTTALSLEAAKIRRNMVIVPDNKDSTIRLATIARVLRMQPFDVSKGYTQHFGLFGLCSAGRDKEGLLFSEQAIPEHVSVWLDLVSRLEDSGSFEFYDMEVRITDISILEKMIKDLNLPREIINRHSLDADWNMFKELGIYLPEQVESLSEISQEMLRKYTINYSVLDLLRFESVVLVALREKYPRVKFTIGLNRKAGLGYYENFCFHIFAKNKDGQTVQLSDGGSVDWVGKLLNGKKERCVTSGFGSELVQKLFSKQLSNT